MMDYIIAKSFAWYKDTMSRGDPRTENWLLAASPFPTFFLCLLYVYTVKVAGPAFMKHRQPFQLRKILVIYNFIMVLLSCWLFFMLGYYGWFGTYNWICQPVDYSENPDAVAMAAISWWYFISKFVEFADTMFFVLRKKNNQLTLLHVVHHGMMPMSCWFGIKFAPDGQSSFFGFINSFVHILMYTYYGLSAVGPHMQKYLWWKKYMTTIQMVQFVIIFVHSFQPLFTDCDYPHFFVYWIGSHGVLFFLLFCDYWRKAYSTSKSSRKDRNESKHHLSSKNGFVSHRNSAGLTIRLLRL
ncbi:ELOVL7 (predicted) [Pycnogonum litorale]